MPQVESILGQGHLPRLGQGFRGRLPGGGGGLHPLPGIPHIHQIQRPPPINFGAVAQVGRQPRQLPPPNPVGQMPQGFGPLPQVPKQMKLSKTERQALGVIKNAYNYKTPKPNVGKLLSNPSPALISHIQNTAYGPKLHNIAKTAWESDQALKAGAKTLPKAALRTSIPKRMQVKTAGVPGLPGVAGALGGWVNRLGSGVADDVTSGGIGLEHLPAAMYHHPLGTPEAMGKEVAQSMYDTVRHPVRMFWDHPDQGIMNALTIASLGAGAGARGVKALDVVGQATRGDITAGEAARALPGALIKTPRMERSIRMGGGSGGGVHFDMNGVDEHGFHKDDYIVDPANLGRRNRMPIYAHRANPEESLIGPPGTGHAHISPAGGRVQASAHIDPDTGAVVNVHFHGNTGLTPAREKMLQQKLIGHANGKLAEAAQRGPGGITVTPPAFKSTIGGLLHTKVMDPLTEKLIDARASGSKVNVFGRDVHFGKLSGGAERHFGKLMRRDYEMRTGMERGAVEHKLLQEWHDTGQIPEGIEPPPKGLSAKKTRQYVEGQIQARAYAEGAATSHANLWHSLWNGGKSARESFDRNPNAYVGVRKPPASWSKSDLAKYSSERQIYHQWNRTVEMDPEKLKADPDAYTFIPKATWKRLRPGEVSYQNAPTQALKYIDAGNQAIRAGRFIHPGYAAWAVQNGVLHVSQAGMHVFRNVYQLRNELGKLSHEDLAKFDNSVGAGHFGGGIARATSGGEESLFKGTTKKLGRFWHNVDDRIPRRLSLIHELNRMGYHNAEDWTKLMKENPRKFRSIAQKAQHQAIDYAEMSPTERATLQKLFTAYGWTRGASTYTARFPLEHPVQAAGLMELARQGKKQRDDFWNSQGGMVPDWLRGSMPFGKGAHPWLGATGDINPGETLGQSLESIPWLVKGPEQPPAEQLGPAAQGLYEFATMQDRFGNKLKGAEHITKPISDTLHRFTPLSYLNVARGAKKGGGTFLESPKQGLFNFLGIPVNQLRDPKTTAALGMKDWEQSLPKPEEIQFRYNQGIKQLPQELALYRRKNGSPLDSGSIAQLKGDMEAVERRDMFQYQYAASKGVHSFRSLPAVDRAKAGVKFMLDHHYFTQSDARDAQAYISSAKTESDMDQAAADIWSSHPIGQTISEWKSTMKQLEPAPLQAARG
jgi:hypothetical protein